MCRSFLLGSFGDNVAARSAWKCEQIRLQSQLENSLCARPPRPDVSLIVAAAMTAVSAALNHAINVAERSESWL